MFMQKKMSLFLKHAMILPAVLILTACSGDKDAEKIAEAQACLNKATAATAEACMEKVAGLTNSGANLIRCSAVFIVQGFSEPATIAAAMDNMKSGSGTSGSTQAMEALAFNKRSTQAANFNDAKSAVSYCTASGAKSLTMLSSIANISTAATYVQSLGGCGSTTEEALDCLANSNDTATKEAVGTSILAAYATNCVGSSSAATQEFCDQFADATNGSQDPVEVANAFLEKYKLN